MPEIIFEFGNKDGSIEFLATEEHLLVSAVGAMGCFPLDRDTTGKLISALQAWLGISAPKLELCHVELWHASRYLLRCDQVKGHELPHCDGSRDSLYWYDTGPARI